MSNISNYIQLEAIIGRIDNDFNIDHSDWIPRIGIWTIAALQQIDGISTKRSRRKLGLNQGSCINILFADNRNNFKLFTEEGCEIKKARLQDVYFNKSEECALAEQEDLRTDYNEDYKKHVDEELTHRTLSIHKQDEVNHTNPSGCKSCSFVDKLDDTDSYKYYNDGNVVYTNYYGRRIIVEYDDFEMSFNETYQCNFPIIPNIGVVVEYIIYYCMYKLLCRGYKHPVFNLSNNASTNPYLIYKSLAGDAKRALINNNQDFDSASKLMRSNFFINTFDPRN